eukprot:3174875-Ditylum_brightwellii.AAC.1
MTAPPTPHTRESGRIDVIVTLQAIQLRHGRSADGARVPVRRPRRCPSATVAAGSHVPLRAGAVVSVIVACAAAM